jgi:colanic acid/amylovoran biosynthesis protein
MRIFILPGTYDCDNMGDVAMLQIALRRLKSPQPDAIIHVLTNAPDKLKFYCPETGIVPWLGCKSWLRVGALPRYFFPGIRPDIRRHFPCDLRRLCRLLRLPALSDRVAARQFADALFNSDLLVISGCGMIADAFHVNALRMLDALEAATRCGIPTTMLGQGLGPIRNRELLQRAAQILPRVGAIFIRERHASMDLLKQLRVPEEKIFVTGDDAVELVFNERSSTPGRHIGVNLRIAGYSALDDKILEIVRTVLNEKVSRHQTVPAGIPIQHGGEPSDIQVLERLLGKKNSGGELDTPLKVIRRVADCRIVITGSYHAGVFALAQGIPVVGIVKSDYYREKFHGLAGEFGSGCIVIQADDAEFSGKLGAAMDELWEQAGELKPGLLSAAELQIKSAHAAYASLPSLLRKHA